MNTPSQRDSAPSIGLCNNYHRPNMKWECGNLVHGCPCFHGPSAGGKCLSNTQCQPVREGDRWQCARPAFRGGSCQAGPDEHGVCCQQRPPCTPRRSLRYRRRMFVTGLTTAVLGFLMILLGVKPAQEVIVPGPLSSGHAELLMHKGADRCAECHPNAHQSVGQWVGQMVGWESPPAKTQTDLCLDCHQQTMDARLARFAHGLSPEQLTVKTKLASAKTPVVPSLSDALFKVPFRSDQQLACATCHREHHGVTVNMTALTNQQCQSCHVQTVGHFATNHSDFELHAGGPTRALSFDHRSHGGKYFVQAQEDFNCSHCHVDDSSGNVKTLAKYETACARCHDAALALSTKSALPFLQLPMLDTVALSKAKVDIGSWPAPLSSDFDGELSGVARLLLEADSEARQAFYELDGIGDWLDLDSDNIRQMQAVGTIARAIKRLLLDLSARGEQAVSHRLQIVFQQELSESQLQLLSAGLSAEMFLEIRSRWFPLLLDEVDWEKAFPVYSSDGPTTLDHQQARLLFSSPIYGRLAPPVDQELLAENPLKDKQPSDTREPSDSNAPLEDFEDRPTNSASRRGQELATFPAAGNGQLLADNPLSGSFGPESTKKTPNGSVQRDSPLALSPRDQSRSPDAEAGELLATNPLSGEVAPEEGTVAQSSETSSSRPTLGQEDLLAPRHDSGADSAGQPLQQEQSQLVRAMEQMGLSSGRPRSGWLRDDTTFSLSYRAKGHEDPWLSGWLALTINQKTRNNVGQASAVDLFRQWASLPVVDSCLQCHNANQLLPSTPVDHPDNLMARSNDKGMAATLVSTVIKNERKPKSEVLSTGISQAQAPTILAPFRQVTAAIDRKTPTGMFSWTAVYRDPMIRTFTNFNHRPHTLQNGVMRCDSCHQMVESPPSEMAISFEASGSMRSDFHPMVRQQCASCHRSEGTSDSCTTCHNYHVGSRRLK